MDFKDELVKSANTASTVICSLESLVGWYESLEREALIMSYNEGGWTLEDRDREYISLIKMKC